ncbi:MAG: hypothetical protein NVSMB24_33980 [Mucilaginibacter sp.]
MRPRISTIDCISVFFDDYLSLTSANRLVASVGVHYKLVKLYIAINPLWTNHIYMIVSYLTHIRLDDSNFIGFYNKYLTFVYLLKDGELFKVRLKY